MLCWVNWPMSTVMTYIAKVIETLIGVPVSRFEKM